MARLAHAKANLPETEAVSAQIAAAETAPIQPTELAGPTVLANTCFTRKATPANSWEAQVRGRLAEETSRVVNRLRHALENKQKAHADTVAALCGSPFGNDGRKT